MINVKIERRENGSVASVLSQGHSNAQVCAAVSILMQACGHQLEVTKSGVMEITEKEMCLIGSIKQTKPAIAIADTLVNGLLSLGRQYPFSVTIMEMLNK